MEYDCKNCGRPAIVAVVMDNLPYANYTPLCDYCLQEHWETEQEIADHEMRHFGGAYGIPCSHTVPLEEIPIEVEFEEVRESLLLNE